MSKAPQNLELTYVQNIPKCNVSQTNSIGKSNCTIKIQITYYFFICKFYDLCYNLI